MCFYKHCWATPLMLEDYAPWLSVFYLLKSEVLSSNGLGKSLMAEAEMLDIESLALLAAMDAVFKKATGPIE